MQTKFVIVKNQAIFGWKPCKIYKDYLKKIWLLHTTFHTYDFYYIRKPFILLTQLKIVFRIKHFRKDKFRSV